MMPSCFEQNECFPQKVTKRGGVFEPSFERGITRHKTYLATRKHYPTSNINLTVSQCIAKFLLSFCCFLGGGTHSFWNGQNTKLALFCPLKHYLPDGQNKRVVLPLLREKTRVCIRRHGHEQLCNDD
jgi:hypothetical protein